MPELETSVCVVSRGFRSIRVHDVKHTYGHRLRAADIIGLYLKPPQHAAVFCVDEKTATQPFHISCYSPLAIVRARAQAEVADLIGGKGGTRTLDPGIMSAVL